MENIVEHKKEKDALLAAVQASAVGLAKQPQQSVPIRIQNEKGEEYVYSNEDVDLVPMIPEISTMDEAVTQANEDQEVVVNSIPIHVLREMEFQDLPTARIQQTSSIFSNRPWQFMLMAGRVPAALTVVIILSLFGYFSFSKNAQYASVASSSVNQSGSTLVNDISKWVSYIGTKELIYIRK
jgi:hypothetical protein